jgi:succinate dehydrogenase/fumarate reductase flavoprotein subunit
VTIRRLIAASVIGAGLAGCVSAPAVKEASQATPNKASKSPIALQAYHRTAVENAAKGKLKDPYSAMFSNVIAFRQSDSRTV